MRNPTDALPTAPNPAEQLEEPAQEGVEEEEVVEVEQGSKGDPAVASTRSKSSTSTASKTTQKCPVPGDDDDHDTHRKKTPQQLQADKEALQYQVHWHATVTVSKDSVTSAKDKFEAKQAYSNLYDNLHTIVLWVKPNFFTLTKNKVLESILLQDGTHLTNEGSNICSIEK